MSRPHDADILHRLGTEQVRPELETLDQLSVDDLVETGVGGTPQQAIDRLAALAEAGVQRIYLQFPGFTDIDHLELIAAEVLPAARAL